MAEVDDTTAMTDQPLPLKPCLICGKVPFRSEGYEMQGCVCVNLFPTDKEWSDNFGWRLIAEKEAEIFSTKNRLEVLHLTIKAKNLKIQEQSEQIEGLKLLAEQARKDYEREVMERASQVREIEELRAFKRGVEQSVGPLEVDE